jgi:hypothetical protein
LGFLPVVIVIDNIAAPVNGRYLVGSSVAVVIAAMAAFGLTRLDFRGRTFWFMLIFSGTVFPFQMYLIPLFFTYRQVGILNTRFLHRHRAAELPRANACALPSAVHLDLE